MPVNLNAFADSTVNTRMIEEAKKYELRKSKKDNPKQLPKRKPRIVTDWKPNELYSHKNVSNNKAIYPTSVNTSSSKTTANNNSRVVSNWKPNELYSHNNISTNNVVYPTSVVTNNKQKSKEIKETKEFKENEEPIESEETIENIKNFIYGLGQNIDYAYHKYFQQEDNTNDISSSLQETLLRQVTKPNKLEFKDIKYWNEKERKDKIEQLSDSIRNNIISLKIPTFRNNIGFASGIATPDSRFFTTNRGEWTNQKGYNIAAPWNDWVDTDKAYKDPSLIKNSYFNRWLPEGQYPTYVVVDNEGKMSISDTIPNIKGKITTGYYTKGKRIVPGSWRHETGNNAWQFMTGDSIPSSPNSSISSYTYNKNNLDNLNNPVVNMIVGNLPNGEQTWIMPYGRTHNQFVKDVNNFSSAFGEERPDLKFVSFDAGRNRYSIMDNTPRIYTGFGNFPNLLLKYKYGGHKSLRNYGK